MRSQLISCRRGVKQRDDCCNTEEVEVTVKLAMDGIVLELGASSSQPQWSIEEVVQEENKPMAVW